MTRACNAPVFNLAAGQLPAVVGATILDREEFAIEIEDGDEVAFNVNDLPRARGISSAEATSVQFIVHWRERLLAGGAKRTRAPGRRG